MPSCPVTRPTDLVSWTGGTGPQDPGFSPEISEIARGVRQRQMPCSRLEDAWGLPSDAWWQSLNGTDGSRWPTWGLPSDAWWQSPDKPKGCRRMPAARLVERPHALSSALSEISYYLPGGTMMTSSYPTISSPP
jgi:hypothetical protein